MTTLTSPKDLLSAIPFLIGFEPKDSIVLLSLKNDAIAMAIRIDFPSQIDNKELDTLAAHLSRDKADSAIAIFYQNLGSEESEFLVSSLLAAINNHGLTLREVVIVEAGLYRSLICEDENCCPRQGSPLPELIDSQIAAEQVAMGRPIPFTSIEQLVDSISAFESDSELDDLITQVGQIDYDGNPLVGQRQGAEAVNKFINIFRQEGMVRDKDLIALLLVRLKDLQVRDYALGSVTAESLDLYFTAWRWLLRIAPIGHIAPVANLFAAVAYERGDGALAQRALDRAEEDDGNYAMSKLLRQVFTSGWAQTAFADMRSELHPKICLELFSGTI